MKAKIPPTRARAHIPIPILRPRPNLPRTHTQTSNELARTCTSWNSDLEPSLPLKSRLMSFKQSVRDPGTRGKIRVRIRFWIRVRVRTKVRVIG